MNRPARRRAPPLRPAPEELEGRRLLSAAGQADPVLLAALSGYLRSASFVPTTDSWADGVLTYSFAPDGTDVGGVPSDLDRAMAARGIATADWEAQFDRAAATWGAATGVRFARVPDDGEPIGSQAAVGGVPHFGEIRIAGIAQADQWLAGTFAPPPGNLGTMAGDIVLNTDKPWAVDDDGLKDMIDGEPMAPAAFDVLTVALHEFGHDLGVGELDDPAAAGYEDYNGIKKELTPDDLAHVADSAGVTPRQAIAGLIAGDPRWSEFALLGAGDSSTTDVVVDTTGFFQVFPWAAGGSVRVTMTGVAGAITLEPGRATLAYLAAGRYQVRVEDAGPGPASGLVAILTPDYEADSLLANGVGQAPAASFRILAAGTPTAVPSAPATPPAAPVRIALPGPPAGPVVGAPAFTAGLPLTLGGGPVGRPTAAGHVAAGGPGAVALAHGGSSLPYGILPVADGWPRKSERTIALAASGPADSRPIAGSMAEVTWVWVDRADEAVPAEVERPGPGLAGFSAWSTDPASGDPGPAAVGAPDADRVEAAGLSPSLAAAVLVPALVLRYRHRLAAWLGRWRGRAGSRPTPGSPPPPAKSPRRQEPSRARGRRPAAGPTTTPSYHRADHELPWLAPA